MKRSVLVQNVLRVKPNATLEDMRRIAPALADVPDSELADWASQTRRRLGLASRGGGR